MSDNETTPPPAPKTPSMFGLLRPYRMSVAALVALTILANALNLLVPRVTAAAINAYQAGTFDIVTVVTQFGAIALLVLLFTFLQAIVQTYASERVARDMREELSGKISRQSYAYIQTANPSKLLTNLTSDIDSIKTFVAQGIAALLSSVSILVGASILLLTINWRLALAVLTIIPIIGLTFFMVLGQVRKLFLVTRAIIDKLNRVINESILGAALIRVLNTQVVENEKFSSINTEARDVGLKILGLFASMIPIITFVANAATIIILALGGHFVIQGSMSLGDFAAFNSYVALLIFPIIIIGFMSNLIAQASASYARIYEVLSVPEQKPDGTVTDPLKGDIEVAHVNLAYGEKRALKDVSFTVRAGSKLAIIGPTAAGKTQLLYLLTGLIAPTSGTIMYDGKPLSAYDPEALHAQIGFVFQDSIIFNMTLRENIAFNRTVTDDSMQKAVHAAELDDFIQSLPQGLDTVISERGTNLSGGQKQRVMLARALAINPRILLLDDFTARVDQNTEAKILSNIASSYPGLTLISVTQKVAAVEAYEQIMVLMEGEVVGLGTHDTLLHTSPEYAQIYASQRSAHELA